MFCVSRIMSRGVYLSAVLFLLVALASAQEINVAIGLGGRPTPVTIFDQIEDGLERRAFRELWEGAPRAQVELATRFVDQYPRSVVLREAYNWLRARSSQKAISRRASCGEGVPCA